MVMRKSLVAALCGLLATADAFGPAARSVVRNALLERADELRAEYDYVIVGGGTAGLTVADRLTEDGRYTVLVIEIGVVRALIFPLVVLPYGLKNG